MKPAQMPPHVREAFAGLPVEAKQCLESWIRNKLTVLVGTNDLEAGDSRVPELLRGYARQRNRAAEVTLQELKELLGDRNGHLGSRRET